MSVRQSLNDHLRARLPLRFVGVYDGLSAYVAERSGAQALWVSGLCVAASKALPDNELVTHETLLRRLADVRRGSSLPILADGNTGFGGEQVIGHLIRLLIRAGIDGVAVEDKAFPRRNSFQDDGPLILEEPETFASKLKRAADARGGESLLLAARTEGLIAGESISKVMTRAEIYTDAGADAIILHSKAKDETEVLAAVRAWDQRVPLIVIPTTYPRLSFATAAAAGVSGIICANQPMRVFMTAMADWMASLMRSDSIEACDAPMAPLSDLLEFVQTRDAIHAGH